MEVKEPDRRWLSGELRKLAVALSFARTSQDLAEIKQVLSQDAVGTHAIVALPESYSMPWVPRFSFAHNMLTEHIVPYLSHQNLYFIHHERLERTQLAIDYTISFDTNAANYVGRIVENRSLDGLAPGIARTFHHILLNNFNFDAFFYCIENIKQGCYAARKMRHSGYDLGPSLWGLLDERFRQNLISIQLFNAVDCQHYRNSGALKFNITRDEAVRGAVQFAYAFYSSSYGRELINEWLLPLHRVILLYLLGILRVQFSSKSAPQEKFRQFLEFVQETVGVYLEREAVLALRYFGDPRSLPLLQKVNRGGTQRELMAKIANIAWDMTAPRYMERMLTAKLQGDYTVPFFLSFDRALCRALKEFPIKAAIIDSRSANVLSVPEVNSFEYFRSEGCEEIVRDFFSPARSTARRSRERLTPLTTLNRIRAEYRRLYALLMGGSGV